MREMNLPQGSFTEEQLMTFLGEAAKDSGVPIGYFLESDAIDDLTRFWFELSASPRRDELIERGQRE